MEQKIRERLAVGQTRYGHGVRVDDNTRDWGTKKNSWMEMAEEELLDCVVYVIANYIRRSRDESGSDPCEFKNDFFIKLPGDDNCLIMHIWNNKDRMRACTTKTMLFSLESLLNMTTTG